MKNIVLSFFLVIACFLSFLSCQTIENVQYITCLDSLEFDHIVNLYGPPNRSLSFGRDTLRINDQTFTRGLGTHAPAELNVDLDGKALSFSAMVGIDNEITRLWDAEAGKKTNNFPDYVYDNHIDHYDATAGGTVVFRVLVDDKVVFESELMQYDDKPQPIAVKLKGARKLTLIADPTGDGSYADHVNWADAKIQWKEKPELPAKLYNNPDDVLVNHIGFLPQSFKTCYAYGSKKTNFSLKDSTGNTVFTDEMIPHEGIPGNYLVGNFTEFEKSGAFFIQVGDRKSEKFRIAEDVYLQALQANINYINQQRSGDPDGGWTKGQHLDDGVREDNGLHQNVTGGWYDANDLRKPTKGNSLLLLALATIAEHNFSGIDKMLLLDEIQWGNKFLLAMQEPQGYLMSYIGSTKDSLMDNRWTDNIVGNEDDRTILTDPVDASHQMIFAIANAKIARLYKQQAPNYAEDCLSAAIKAWQWSLRNQPINDPDDLGTAISTATNLYLATYDETYQLQAVKLVEQLIAGQQRGDEYLSHHFFSFSEKGQTYGGRWIMLGLQDFIRTWPDHPLNSRATTSLQQFADGYYRPLSKLNSFGIIPWIFSTKRMGGDKQYGPYFYRNFLHVGMNQHVSSKGVAMSSAFLITRNQEHLNIAQQQLDWIYGANPFNASSVTGMGYNQPALFKTSLAEFTPHTPELKGGVMTGIGSNSEDKIAFFPGYWWTTEYWSPSVAYTMLLTTMLQASYQIVEN